jgi:hypothetical protein
MRVMRRIPVTIALFVGLSVLSSMGCSQDPPASPRDCFDALNKGRQMLSVPDFDASKSWLAQAKKQCLADQQAAVAQLEKDIAATQARAAEIAKQREESFKAKPPSESSVPAFIEAAAKYRDQKKREKCDADPCGEVETVGPLTIRRSTGKGSRDAFRVFTRMKERVGCDQLGANTVKRRWEVESQIKFYCSLTGGTLSGLNVLLEQEKERPETYVVVFSDKWLERDEQLGANLAADK